MTGAIAPTSGARDGGGSCSRSQARARSRWYADLGLTDLSHGVELELAQGAAVPLVVGLALIALVTAWPLRRAVRH